MVEDIWDLLLEHQILHKCKLELSVLTDIARSQPHAVFSLCVHGFASK